MELNYVTVTLHNYIVTHQAKSRTIVRSLSVGEVSSDEQFLLFTCVCNEHSKRNSLLR